MRLNTTTLPTFFTFKTSGSLENPSREVVGDAIIFNSVQIGTSSVYQCNASNEHGYLLANAFVNILGEKFIKELSSSLVVLHTVKDAVEMKQ